MIDLFFKNRGMLLTKDWFRYSVIEPFHVFKIEINRYRFNKAIIKGRGKLLLLVFEKSKRVAWLISPSKEQERRSLLTKALVLLGCFEVSTIENEALDKIVRTGQVSTIIKKRQSKSTTALTLL